jgi:hypothetical protein
MSGKKSGVYVKVVKKYPLSEDRYVGGTLVAILECKHAVILKPNGRTVKRSRCVLCTREKIKNLPPPPKGFVRVSDLKSLVAEGVRKELEKLTAPTRMEFLGLGIGKGGRLDGNEQKRDEIS